MIKNSVPTSPLDVPDISVVRSAKVREWAAGLARDEAMGDEAMAMNTDVSIPPVIETDSEMGVGGCLLVQRYI